ncbi:hypothetical protein [Microcoleus sp. FACHB-68]|uniref:hypothetical protein n=1 Tax=Microcoleus sp. FACHB-68 TaxID=2692826 RepID=UPI001990244D|nr:hypothetical protein [Microcoleus sp. FACHB-68]MBD1938853.1 hypothetical protein [Microcoleus sp. FACHB-68]
MLVNHHSFIPLKAYKKREASSFRGVFSSGSGMICASASVLRIWQYFCAVNFCRLSSQEWSNAGEQIMI